MRIYRDSCKVLSKNYFRMIEERKNDVEEDTKRKLKLNKIKGEIVSL